jgi:phosphoglycolate phosphatase
LNKNIKAVIYDLDGTLVDSAPVVLDILNKLRMEMGLPSLKISKIYELISLGGSELIIGALKVSGSDVDYYLAEFRRLYFERNTKIESIYPNVIRALNILCGNGIKLAICSNKPRILVDKVLTDTNMGKFFDCVLAGDDLKTKKPSPANLNWCLGALDVAHDEAFFVGDSTVDQRAALNADIRFAFFQCGYNDGVNQSQVAYKFNDHEVIAKKIICYK